MPCFEYHPRRFVVEMDVREYEFLLDVCKGLLNIRRKPKPRDLGECISKLLSFYDWETTKGELT